MALLSVLIVLVIRCLLVALFLPFSALDKVLNFAGAVRQASEATRSTGLARALIVAGLFVEVAMSLCVVTGVADRLAAFILAGYCGVTALLWKQFWRPGDFFKPDGSVARGLFWDFLKNFALAGGFLLIAFGGSVAEVRALLSNPAISSYPYRLDGSPR